MRICLIVVVVVKVERNEKGNQNFLMCEACMSFYRLVEK
jgi:hypothetical protein